MIFLISFTPPHTFEPLLYSSPIHAPSPLKCVFICFYRFGFALKIQLITEKFVKNGNMVFTKKLWETQLADQVLNSCCCVMYLLIYFPSINSYSMTFDFILLQAMEDAVICILGRSVGWPGSWRLGSAQCWNQGDPFNDYWNSPDETI